MQSPGHPLGEDGPGPSPFEFGPKLDSPSLYL